jgi:hypothetical protein
VLAKLSHQFRVLTRTGHRHVISLNIVQMLLAELEYYKILTNENWGDVIWVSTGPTMDGISLSSRQTNVSGAKNYNRHRARRRGEEA